MARTSRTAAPNNVAALDNIDLDDMFTEGADDLFEGLGIDIDMDEIDTTTTTEATEPQHQSAAASAPKATTKNKSTKSQSKLPTASSLAAATTNEGATGTAAGPSVATSRSRRKTKRKILEEDDDSYEEPQTKKTKRKPAKRKGQTKKASEPTSSILASFAKQRPTATAASLPLTKAPQLMAQHPKSSTAAAAASSSSILPTNGGSLKRKAPPRTTAAPATSQHCGISPSNTVFYPFLDLPNEFLLKSKKPFPTVDKVHTAFQSQLQQQQQQPQQPTTAAMQPPPENDPLIRLLQDGKLDAETVSRAVTAMRSTLTPASTSIADWHNIARILQRQHDFLQQSAANMQAWCRNNYTEAEFADVYSGTVLRSFPTPHIKVKILLGKDKNKALLPATLPSYIVRSPAATAASTTTTAARTTKASTSKASSSNTNTTTTTSRPKPVASVPQPPTPYTHLCSAAARRKAIADRLSQVAPLATVPTAATPQYRPMVLPSLPTTLSMWKWLEHSGYWGTNPRVARAARVDPWTVPATTTQTTTPLKPLAVEERLQSLLVEQDCDDDSSTAMDEDDDDILDANDCMESSSALLDASALSTEERWRWVLQRAGWEPPLAADDTAAAAGTTQVEDMIHTMMEDLHATDGLNNERLSYLEAAASSMGDDKKTRQQETALMAKCQQLLIKKSKEKAKAAVVTKRDDDIQLPW